MSKLLGAANIDNKKHIVPSDKLSTSNRKININCIEENMMNVVFCLSNLSCISL